ncbi:MAG: beta-N-acetylhexosaminidase [Burkholderiales bacterium]
MIDSGTTITGAAPIVRRGVPLGPVMIDVAGLTLSAEERERLAHPAVGGVILFARNFESPLQLGALTAAIRAARSPALLIAVDHEGGRVQRFQTGFTRLPAMRTLGALYDQDQARGETAAYDCGLVMASELISHGIDISFAPVLDIDFGGSSVIGDRAFHRDPVVVARLAGELVAGMKAAGVGAVGKHFPGHGFVRGDSHHELPIDGRSLDTIRAEDLLPYRLTIPRGLAGVMPAHVIYTQVDERPAGFSARWLQGVLRDELGFRGMVFSDDLSMEGAKVGGGIADRAVFAFEAGCDMVLVCNDTATATTLLDELPRVWPQLAIDPERVALMRPAGTTFAQSQREADYLEARRSLARTLSA